MADQEMNGCKQQVAWEMAQMIARNENRVDDVTVGFPPKGKEREYWLRLMDQCVNVLEHRDNIENIVLAAQRDPDE